MGKLYDNCQLVINEIQSRGLDVYKARGALALETGFLISAVGPNDDDDPQKLEALSDAALKLFGIRLP